MMTNDELIKFLGLVEQLEKYENELRNDPDYFFGFRVDLITGEVIEGLGWHKRKENEMKFELSDKNEWILINDRQLD